MAQLTTIKSLWKNSHLRICNSYSGGAEKFRLTAFIIFGLFLSGTAWWKQVVLGGLIICDRFFTLEYYLRGSDRLEELYE